MKRARPTPSSRPRRAGTVCVTLVGLAAYMGVQMMAPLKTSAPHGDENAPTKGMMLAASISRPYEDQPPLAFEQWLYFPGEL